MTENCLHQTTRTNNATGEKWCVQCDELLTTGTPSNGRATKQMTLGG